MCLVVSAGFFFLSVDRLASINLGRVKRSRYRSFRLARGEEYFGLKEFVKLKFHLLYILNAK